MDAKWNLPVFIYPPKKVQDIDAAEIPFYSMQLKLKDGHPTSANQRRNRM